MNKGLKLYFLLFRLGEKLIRIYKRNTDLMNKGLKHL